MYGKWLCLSRRLYKEVKGFAMAFATHFIILLLIPSGPEALCMLSISSMSITFCSEMIIWSSLASVFGIKLGSAGWSWDSVEIVVKYSFKHSTFSQSVTCMLVSLFSFVITSGGIEPDDLFSLTKCLTIFRKSCLLFYMVSVNFSSRLL